MALLRFEEIPEDWSFAAGPFRIGPQHLADFVQLTGEGYPIHTDDAFAARTFLGRHIPPGKMLHAVAAARQRESGVGFEVLALRGSHYDYLSPIHLDEPFWVRARLTAREVLDDERGLVRTVRQILNADGRVASVGRLTQVVARRAHGARLRGG